MSDEKPVTIKEPYKMGTTHIGHKESKAEKVLTAILVIGLAVLVSAAGIYKISQPPSPKIVPIEQADVRVFVDEQRGVVCYYYGPYAYNATLSCVEARE